MDIYFYLAVAGIIIIISWRMVSGFRKGMVQEILSLIAMVCLLYTSPSPRDA